MVKQMLIDRPNVSNHFFRPFLPTESRVELNALESGSVAPILFGSRAQLVRVFPNVNVK